MCILPSYAADINREPSGQNLSLITLCKWPIKCSIAEFLIGPPISFWHKWIFWQFPPNATSVPMGDHAKQFTANGNEVVDDIL